MGLLQDKFFKQIKVAAKATEAKVFALSRLMTRVGGRTSTKRRLLEYETQVWADALEMKDYRKYFAQLQRMRVLRVPITPSQNQLQWKQPPLSSLVRNVQHLQAQVED